MKSTGETALKGATDARVGQVEIAISNRLRIGVTTSMVIILVGLVLMFVHHPSYVYAGPDLQRLISPVRPFRIHCMTGSRGYAPIADKRPSPSD